MCCTAEKVFNKALTFNWAIETLHSITQPQWNYLFSDGEIMVQYFFYIFFYLQWRRRRQSERGSWSLTVSRSSTVRPLGPSCLTTQTLWPPWISLLQLRSSWCGKKLGEWKNFSLCRLSPCGMPGCLRYQMRVVFAYCEQMYTCPSVLVRHTNLSTVFLKYLTKQFFLLEV